MAHATMVGSGSGARRSVTSLHVAGVGASAGGLEAMLPMCANLRPTGRIAYVVAQHMSPGVGGEDHCELMARLIRRESSLPVVIGVEGMKLVADTIHIIPSGRNGRVRGGALWLSTPGPEHISKPSVSVLFASIAEACGRQAIGIVLSGTGYDGVAGCRDIRAREGLTLAQEPAEAKFDGMPMAAIEAGLVDRVLPADQIGPTLATLFPGTPAASWSPVPSVSVNRNKVAVSAASSPVADVDVSTPEKRELQTLLRQVLDATGVDFSSYKEDTLLRRLEKRKAVVGAGSAEAYQALIGRNPGELHELQHLFLVSVSSFFRDRQSFCELERAMSGLLADKRAGEPIRVWVPGCASGEEPYTIAIILHEVLGARRRDHPIVITATDLNPEALAIARAGIFREATLREMEDVLRDRYFTPEGQLFSVMPMLKDCIRFEQRDVLSGSSLGEFVDLDLVSCRNLLIYMKSHLQDQLIMLFHKSLRRGGLLFIGQSESLTMLGNSLFAPIDHYHRLFQRRH